MSSLQPMSLSQLVGDEALIPPEWDRDIQHIVTDSRDVSKGDLYLARSGQETHGEVYIDQAIDAGAVAVILEKESGFQCGNNGVPIFSCPALKSHLPIWLKRRYPFANEVVCFGVTGTNGKSSVTQYIAQILDGLGKSSLVVGTLGNGIWPDLLETRNTTPDICVTYRLLDEAKRKGTNYSAMEVSSIGIEQGRIEGLQFAGAVLTNLTQDHLDYHGTMECYFAEKAKLFSAHICQSAVINIDDEYGRSLTQTTELPEQVVTIGCNNKADFYYHSIAVNDQGMQFILESSWGSMKVQLGLVGEFNAANAVAAIACLVLQGFDLDSLVTAAHCLIPVPGRMELYTAAGKPKVIVDYAHTPDAIKNVVSTLKDMTESVNLVFGCGGDRDRSKRPLMAEAANAANQVWVTDDNPRTESPEQIFDDIKQAPCASNFSYLHGRKEAIRQAIEQTDPQHMLVIAGKGHETYQEISGVKHPYSDADSLFELGYTKVGGRHAA